MRANELRVGDFIKQPNGINEVFLIEDRETTYYINTFPINDIEPIPLTEEWLLKFGFRKDGVYFDDDNIVLIRQRGTNNQFKLDYQKSQIIEFVHQLQNLYSSLIGQELTIK